MASLELVYLVSLSSLAFQVTAQVNKSGLQSMILLRRAGMGAVNWIGNHLAHFCLARYAITGTKPKQVHYLVRLP